jgi:hypothetical protein
MNEGCMENSLTKMTTQSIPRDMHQLTIRHRMTITLISFNGYKEN